MKTTVKTRRRPRTLRRFPGEASWLWHLQLQMERIISPLRVAAIAVTAIAWATGEHPQGSLPVAARADLVAASIYAMLNAIVIYRFGSIVQRWPWGSTVLDFAFVTSFIGFTGGPRTPFAMLAAVTLAAVPLRNPPALALVVTLAYTSAVVALTGLSHWYLGFYLAVIGTGLTVWTAATYRDRRNSLRDDLTGSFTREYAAFRLRDVYRQAAFPIALAVIDLDGFKDINDTFGHPAGDTVLVQAVRSVASAIRQGDLLARSGGDEFMLILPRTDLRSARTIAERVRTGIELTRFRHRRDLPPVRLTASIGVAVADDATTDETTLIARADDRLYAAKESGRNRVVAE